MCSCCPYHSQCQDRATISKTREGRGTRKVIKPETNGHTARDSRNQGSYIIFHGTFEVGKVCLY